jgi:Mn2+/Fe2+ NRAMP family transporter
MATSAIGPGFLTQTAVFTGQFGASFGFAILVSVVFDLAVQVNIWRTLVAADRRAQDLASDVTPGLGPVLAVLVALGGFAFNIGNVAGAGLGLNVLTGLDVETGAAISALVAISLFLVKDAGRAIDRFAQVMGVVMIGLTLYVAVSSHPPLVEALHRTVAPRSLQILAIVTIVGGTVGGYIPFVGAHRLLDAGVRGPRAVGAATRAALLGIAVATAMRVALFAAALGVASQGLALDPANPPASVFRHAAGDFGFRIFGVVLWAAAITSVVGSAWTSVSFLRSLHPLIERRQAAAIVSFIVASAAVFVLVGRPVKLLVLAGALNGLILPVSLAAVLVAARRSALVGGDQPPRWLTASGAVVAVVMLAMGVYVMAQELPKLFR